MGETDDQIAATKLVGAWSDTLPPYESHSHSDGVRLVQMITDLLAAQATELEALRRERDAHAAHAREASMEEREARAKVAWLEGIRLPHARTQENANGFQRGWHAALSRVSEGDEVHLLSALVPEPAVIVEVPVCEAEAVLSSAQRSYAMCADHQPDVWEGDGTCVLCEAHDNYSKLQAAEAELAEARQVNGSLATDRAGARALLRHWQAEDAQLSPEAPVPPSAREARDTLREALQTISDTIHERYPDPAQQAARMQAVAEAALSSSPATKEPQ